LQGTWYKELMSHFKIGYKNLMGGTGEILKIQGGSNMTGTDLCVNKPHCAAAVRP